MLRVITPKGLAFSTNHTDQIKLLIYKKVAIFDSLCQCRSG